VSRASELGSVVAEFEVFSGSVGAEEGKKGGQVGACHQLEEQHVEQAVAGRFQPCFERCLFLYYLAVGFERGSTSSSGSTKRW
jgi:hypothetical protein